MAVKKETKTVYTNDKGIEILHFTTPNKYYIPLSHVDEQELRDLCAAIQEALSEPMIAAVRKAREESREESGM